MEHCARLQSTHTGFLWSIRAVLVLQIIDWLINFPTGWNDRVGELFYQRLCCAPLGYVPLLASLILPCWATPVLVWYKEPRRKCARAFYSKDCLVRTTLTPIWMQPSLKYAVWWEEQNWYATRPLLLGTRVLTRYSLLVRLGEANKIRRWLNRGHKLAEQAICV